MNNRIKYQVVRALLIFHPLVVTVRAMVRLPRAMAVVVGLTQAVRVVAFLMYVTAASAVVWAMGMHSQPAPHTGVLVLVWTTVGLAVVRAALLWSRRWYGKSRDFTAGGPGVSLRKSHEAEPLGPASLDDMPYEVRGWLEDVPRHEPWWTKVRQLLVSAGLLAASLTGVLLASLPSQTSQLAQIQRSGAEVATGTITGQPDIVREEHNEDDYERIDAYYSNVRVSVPGAAEPLAVGPIRSSGRPEPGDPLMVLWSPSNPSLGGHTASPATLRRLAEGKWEITFHDGSDIDPQLAFAGAMVLILLPFIFAFAFCFDCDMLAATAWSPRIQTFHALVFAGAAYGYTAALTGQQPSALQDFLQASSWLLLAGLIFSPALRLLAGGGRCLPWHARG
ncbi:hypothetical protein ACFYN0_31375 [Streptomyces sp. NPDC006704]|uniref:hypothetical protein n=1 Tax=Streptomyces sp. NPDC006704 TaxID=3364760 RepID=UPI0036C305E2